ncbi:MAG: PQQ-binding-like beta-propeller repeat protein [Planctomycetota bacterium]
MFARFCVSVALALAAAPSGAAEQPLASVEGARAKLVAHLAGEAHLRVELGDGRGAARALITLAAAAEEAGQAATAALAVLGAYEELALPDDVRAGLSSAEQDVRGKAVRAVADALASMTAEHKLPEDIRGFKILGAAEGCPVRDARAFAGGPGGVVHILSDGLVSYDGKHWQAAALSAIPVLPPVGALFVDSKGWAWLGSADAGGREEWALTEIERVGRWSLAFRDGMAPLGRWRTFVGGRRVTAFAENQAGVWVATSSRLFLCHDGRQMSPASCPLPYSPFRKLLASPESDWLWVIDIDRASRFDGKRWRSLKLGKLRPVGAVISSGKPVIVVTAGLILPGEKRPEFIKFPAGHGAIAAAAAGPDGTIWCVSSQSRLFRTDMKTWGLYRSIARNEFPRQAMPAIFCDAAGRVWLSRGPGIELHAAGRKPEQTMAADKEPIELPIAPLLSSAGSGGWTNDGSLISIPRPEDEETGAGVAAGTGDELGGFEEDDTRGAETTAGLLDDLRKSPRSASIFNRLLKLLNEEPDPAVRKEALLLAAKEANAALYDSPAYVRELAESIIDDGHPVYACMLLLEACELYGAGSASEAVEPALFEALVALEFGEFARPGFLLADITLPRKKDERRGRLEPSAAGAKFGPGVRAVKLDLDLDVGLDELREAGLHQAVILADKRAVLASMGDFARWQKLVDDCIKAGDLEAAKKYGRLTKDMFKWPAAPAKVDKPQKADSVALAPLRWIRRIKIKTDSGLGPVLGGDGKLYFHDEGAGTVTAIDSTTGSKGTPTPSAGLRALIPTNTGAVAIINGGSSLRADVLPLHEPIKALAIGGMTDAFDPFSATPVKDNVFYCFDDGLAKVDLKAGKVVWRNRDIAGGADFWRTLLERAMPVPHEADVLVVSGRRLSCVDAASGKTRWETHCDWSGTPAAAGDVVIVGAGPRAVWGISRKTGERVWKHIGRGRAEGRFISDGQSAFYAMPDGDVAALDAKTGGFLWRRATSISVRYATSYRSQQTALLVGSGRVVACNKYGYVEFDAATGAIFRRLHVKTARPMAVTEGAVIVMTAPDRLVAVADPPAGGLGERVTALAEKAPKRKALGMARLAANYISPGSTAAHELALKLSAGAVARRGHALYETMVASVDPFAPASRKLMRDYVEYVPSEPSVAPRVLRIVSMAHTERGAVREAAAALEELAKQRGTRAVLSALLRLQLEAGDKDAAMRTVRRLVAMKQEGAWAAFAALAEAHMEEEALDVALELGSPNENPGLLYSALPLAGDTGLFEKTEQLLGGRAGAVAAPERARARAYMFSAAGVAGRVLAKNEKALRADIEAYRRLLAERRDALKALDRPEELKLIEERIKRLEKAPFP